MERRMQLYNFTDKPINSIGFTQAIEDLQREFDLGWKKRKAEIAEIMRSFRHDASALRALVRKHVAGGEWPIMQGTQSFYLHSDDRFRIRANLWFQASHPLAKEAGYRDFLSIEKCHNHDFAFFTICVLGSGYTTRLYRARNYRQDLEVGDKVDMMPTETLNLHGDCVMFIERDLDFHSQLFPETLSVTINLIPARDVRQSVQFSVSEPDGVIKRKIYTNAGDTVPDRAWEPPLEEEEFEMA
jgi:hypothetical protein